MRIEIQLDPKAKNAGAVRTQLQSEILELSSRKVQITQKTVEVGDGELGLHEVYQFIVEHADHSITFATAVVSLIAAVIKRNAGRPSVERESVKGKDPKRDPPIVEVKIGDSMLRFPANDSQVRRYLSKALAEGDEKKSPPPRPSAKRPAKKK